MLGNVSIERLRPAGPEGAAVGRAMSLAFLQEPNFAYVMPDEAARERPLAWFFGSFVLRLGIRYGEVYTTSGRAGSAVWLRPGAYVSAWGAIRAGLLAMPLHLGIGGTRRSLALGAHLEQIRKKVAARSHWYLMALGVHPAEQGKGLGRALLQPVLARADEDGIPCYLETFRERTAEFYTRVGFSVVHTDAIPNGGPHFRCMARTPRSH